MRLLLAIRTRVALLLLLRRLGVLMRLIPEGIRLRLPLLDRLLLLRRPDRCGRPHRRLCR